MGILSGIGITVLIVLVLPIRFSVTANNTEGLCADFYISYGLGLVSYVFNRRDGHNKSVVKVLGLSIYSFCPDMDGRYSEQTDTIVDLVRRLKTGKNQLACLKGMAVDTMGSIIGRKAGIVLKLGFEDPAYTGMAAGLISCIFSHHGGILQYTPDFSGENFEVDLYFKGVIIPIVLVFIGLKHGTVYLKKEVWARNNVKGGKRYGFNG